MVKLIILISVLAVISFCAARAGRIETTISQEQLRRAQS
jgi:hypothetical protein